MKNKILFLAITGLIAISAQSFAQNVSTASSTSEELHSDYVTIGSRIPYFVAPDEDIKTLTDAGKMRASIFSWLITNSLDVAITPKVPLLEYDGSAGQEYDAFRTPTAGTGYYDNEISLIWSAANGFSVGTAYKVNAREKSVTLSNTIAGCIAGNTVTKDVFVLARPTVAFIGSEGGGCGLVNSTTGSTFYIPLTVTGLGDWKISYSVSYNDGTAAPVPNQDISLTVATAPTDADVIAQSTVPREAKGSSSAVPDTKGLAVDLPKDQYGYYDVTITNISDRISRKSLTALPVGGFVAGTPAIASYRIYVSPVPVSQPVQHIKNL